MDSTLFFRLTLFRAETRLCNSGPRIRSRVAPPRVFAVRILPRSNLCLDFIWRVVYLYFHSFTSLAWSIFLCAVLGNEVSMTIRAG